MGRSCLERSKEYHMTCDCQSDNNAGSMVAKSFLQHGRESFPKRKPSVVMLVCLPFYYPASGEGIFLTLHCCQALRFASCICRNLGRMCAFRKHTPSNTTVICVIDVTYPSCQSFVACFVPVCDRSCQEIQFGPVISISEQFARIVVRVVLYC